MTNKNMVLCIYLVMGFSPYHLYIDTDCLASKSSQSLYCGGCNSYSACLPCLCSDFINFP